MPNSNKTRQMKEPWEARGGAVLLAIQSAGMSPGGEAISRLSAASGA